SACRPRGDRPRRRAERGARSPPRVRYCFRARPAGGSPGQTGNGTWRSLVAHLTGGQGVAGSNPVVPTSFTHGAGRLLSDGKAAFVMSGRARDEPPACPIWQLQTRMSLLLRCVLLNVPPETTAARPRSRATLPEARCAARARDLRVPTGFGEHQDAPPPPGSAAAA